MLCILFSYVPLISHYYTTYDMLMYYFSPFRVWISAHHFTALCTLSDGKKIRIGILYYYYQDTTLVHTVLMVCVFFFFFSRINYLTHSNSKFVVTNHTRMISCYCCCIRLHNLNRNARSCFRHTQLPRDGETRSAGCSDLFVDLANSRPAQP